MTEWTVVTVVIALAGFLAVVVKPIITLNTSITKLTAAVGTLQENLQKLTAGNADGHERIWNSLDCQAGRISNHETRISVIEKGVK